MNFIKHISRADSVIDGKPGPFNIEDAFLNVDTSTITHQPMVSYVEFISPIEGHFIFGDKETQKLNRSFSNVFNGARIDKITEHCRILFLKDATIDPDPLPLHNLFHEEYVRFVDSLLFGELSKHLSPALDSEGRKLDNSVGDGEQKTPEFALRIQYILFPFIRKLADVPTFSERVFDRYSDCSLMVSLMRVRFDETGNGRAFPIAGIVVNEEGVVKL